MPGVDSEASVHRLSFAFFRAIKKRREFEWTPECEKSSQELKAYMQSPQLVARPITGDILQLYLAVFESALSSILIPGKKRNCRGRYIMSAG
ncbi:hypothetical protein LIER_08238 [Lithospermum erythrorhizon]|uniref:Reverse transcriptase/retrotransposon-derived protein RNase H-like domain-containing protein n=1 Tax=Lithospermum erythrorhizon TaxID=34254 RepID=A0AAV3PB84_LITER